MEPIEIIGHVGNYVRAVRMACLEKGIPHRVVEALPQSPEACRLHPFGKIPSIRSDGFELCESKAIASYLDRLVPEPALIPREPRLEALTEQWISIVNTVIDRTLIREYVLSYVLPRGHDGTPDRGVIDAALPALEQQLAVLDRAVQPSGYLVADRFTFADINLMPILALLQAYPEGQQALLATPALRAYFERHAERPSFRETAARGS
jgi:glutathione S-transferase